MASSITGTGSLDVKSIVAALVNADITPAKNRLDKQEAAYTSKLSAVGQIKAALSKLQSAMAKLSDVNSFYGLTTNVSDPTALIASPDTGATPGSYQLDIQQLASKQSLASTAFANSSTTVGSGTIKIEFGTYAADLSGFTVNPDKAAVDITIAPGQDSLTSIRDAINNSNSGVQASIVKDDQGSKLTITSSATGKSYAMKISVTDSDGNNTDGTGLSALAYDPTAGVGSMAETVAAANSKVKINGLLLEQSNNQLKDAIEGMTLDLKKAQPGTTIFLNVTNNTTQMSDMVNAFVKQYNDTMTTLINLTGYNPDTKQGGIFQSDAGVRGLKNSLSRMISEQVNSTGSIRTLADVGIKTNAQGLLDIDAAKLSKAIADNYDQVGSLFAKTATASDSGVNIRNVGTTAKAGTYNLVLSTFNPGVDIAGTIGGYSTTSANGLTLTGTGVLKDLAVDVFSGAAGARGTITIQDGLAVKFNDLLNQFLGNDGLVSERTDQITKNLKDIADKRTALSTYSDTLTTRYTKQYSALDTLLTQLQSTSAFLSQQLENLPKITTSK
ncbi:flagellar filament capping protein FliD [Legionella dresdenensis]|uniref:Flagellar hook-associated protein 2 n=1 Tax=Legionella dresdenensis TaxID=450200 RepID=A0ABV8CBD0_9GAMM